MAEEGMNQLTVELRFRPCSIFLSLCIVKMKREAPAMTYGTGFVNEFFSRPFALL
jgi:hypothetical protein